MTYDTYPAVIYFLYVSVGNCSLSVATPNPKSAYRFKLSTERGTVVSSVPLPPPEELLQQRQLAMFSTLRSLSASTHFVVSGRH